MTSAQTTPGPDQANPAHQPPHLLAAAGRAYFPIALIARFPYAMMVIGVLTLVVSARGSMSLGGLTSAMVGLGVACFGPLIGAAADRWGQRRVLLATGVISSFWLLVISWAAYSTLGAWSLLVTAFLIGASTPQVPPLSRSRLVGIISEKLPVQRRQKTINNTMAYESAADEVTFVFGPMIVGALAATMGAAAPMIGAAVLTLIFLTTFALHPTADAVPKSSKNQVTAAPARELFTAGLLVVTIGVLGVGTVFGSTLTTLTAIMNEAGAPELAGLAYGVMGVGSAIFALGAALFPTSFSMRARWLSFAPLILIGAVGMQLAPNPVVMVLVLVLMGVGVGPTLVTVFNLVAQRSPRGRSATAMSMASTSIIVGQSAAAAVTGQLAEVYDSTAAVVVVTAAAALIVLAAAANWLISGPRERSRA